MLWLTKDIKRDRRVEAAEEETGSEWMGTVHPGSADQMGEKSNVIR